MTRSEMAKLWANRDNRYRALKRALTQGEIDSILAYRKSEVIKLITVPIDQMKMLTELSQWRAPLVGEKPLSPFSRR